MALMQPDLEARMAALEAELRDLRRKADQNTRDDTVSVICFSGEWDRLFAAFTIANGALAMGQEVDLFFTFWGAASLCTGERDPDNQKLHWSQRAFRRLLPRHLGRTRLSKFHFGGLGKRLLGNLATKHGVADLQDLADDARELGAKFHYCDTSFDLLGLSASEVFGGDEAQRCGVATFLGKALKANMVLFI